MNSYLIIISLVACCFSTSCTSQKKERERAENTAKALSTIGIIATLKTAEVVHEFGRVVPHVASWKDGQIELSGIKSSMISEFFVWSVTDSKLLWWLRQGQGHEDYSKKSKNEKFSMTYGVAPEEWKQRLPFDKLPKRIDEGVLLVYFDYSYPTIFGMAGESAVCYVKLSDKATEILRQSELGEDSWITSQEHWEIWDTVNKTMIEMRNPAAKKKDSEPSIAR